MKSISIRAKMRTKTILVFFSRFCYGFKSGQSGAPKIAFQNEKYKFSQPHPNHSFFAHEVRKSEREMEDPDSNSQFLDELSQEFERDSFVENVTQLFEEGEKRQLDQKLQSV